MNPTAKTSNNKGRKSTSPSNKKAKGASKKASGPSKPNSTGPAPAPTPTSKPETEDITEVRTVVITNMNSSGSSGDSTYAAVVACGGKAKSPAQATPPQTTNMTKLTKSNKTKNPNVTVTLDNKADNKSTRDPRTVTPRTKTPTQTDRQVPKSIWDTTNISQEVQHNKTPLPATGTTPSVAQGPY